jgi:hypothetical protein
MTFNSSSPLQKWTASALLLVGLSLCVALADGYNSDALTSYSPARDLLQLHSLRGWVFSAAPSFVPDVLIALPFTVITDNPASFYLLTSPVQLAILLLALSIWLHRTQRLAIAEAFFDLSISATLFAFVCSAVLFPVGYFVIQPLFIFAAHGFAAIFAVLFFCFLFADDFSLLRKHPLWSLSAFILLSISDLFFAFYLGTILFALLLFSRSKRLFGYVIACGLLSVSIFALAYFLNPSLSRYIIDSSHGPSGFSPLGVALRIICLMTMPTACLLVLRKQQRLTRDLLVLYVSLLLVCVLIGFAGLLKEKYSFRYLSISFPISIVFISEVLSGWRNSQKLKLFALAACWLIAGLIEETLIRKNSTLATYAEEIACIQSVKGPAGSSIVADYWPAKIVFEATKRNYNLLQVDARLRERVWVSNKRWRYIHREEADSQTFVLTDFLEAQSIDRIKALSYAHPFCDDKIILVDKPLSQIQEIEFTRD